MSMRLILCACLLLAMLVPAGARTLHGTVTHVTDGDSLWVRTATGGEPLQVRVQGIDAPEICQVFGVQARDALAAHLMHQPVEVNTRARDIYHRTVGRVSLGGQDVGAWMVSRGYAWSPGFRHRPGPYATQETEARKARLGLWAQAAPVEPRSFRKRHGSCKRL